MDLTPKQALFVKEYLVDLNATQAAIRAGYSEKTAGSIGSENLQKPEIQIAVQKAMDERAERLGITTDYVLGTIQNTIARCNDEETYQPNYVLKGAELLGKSLKLFTDKVEHTGKDGGAIEMQNMSELDVARAIMFALDKGGRDIETCH